MKLVKKREKREVESPALTLDLNALSPDLENRRRHNERNIEAIADSLRAVGAARSVVIDEHNTILAGNGVQSGAERAGITKVRVIETDGQEIIAVRRRGLSLEQKRLLAMADNRTAELSEWDPDRLQADALAGLDLRPFFTEEEEAGLFSKAAADAVIDMAAAAEADADVTMTPRQPGPNNHTTFTCPLTVEEERIVRGAVRRAREAFEVTTTGAALACALGAWLESLEDVRVPSKSRSRSTRRRAHA